MKEDRKQQQQKGERSSHPLHACRLEQPRATIYRLQALVHSVAIVALIYYRASWLRLPLSPGRTMAVTLSWSLVFGSELLLSFLYLLGRSFRWKPLSRTVFPSHLPRDDNQLPPIDVFICTADPEKEPPVKVMNTVLSAMALDYPAEKLTVYLSDDGGSPITLHALRQASSFATLWLPFCTKHGIENRCPEAYFSTTFDNKHLHASDEFLLERGNIKSMYEVFKESIDREKYLGSSKAEINGEDHQPSLIEIICNKGEGMADKEQAKIPMLVYVSREKKHSYPHHFKAGALNVLLRVSSILSNSPYILFLDCDMYSNDPTSARQAMCFHIDPNISASLAYVQFPQTFHNISSKDIYDSQLREIFKIWWKGCNGIKGPPLSGTNFYMRREALYAATPGYSFSKWMGSMDDLLQIREFIGPSNELIKSMRHSHKCNVEDRLEPNTSLMQEVQLLASCTYEEGTKWGKKIGFLYDSVLEDFVTGFLMHCGGWISVYIDPPKPSFMGTAPINLNDFLIQNKRWATGLLQVAFSRFCPLTHRSNSLLLSSYYGFLAFQPLYSLSVVCYATIPPLCLLNGISLYPQVSDPWFGIFSFIYVSSLCQQLSEVFFDGGSFQMWWNEQRIWMAKMASAYFLACLDVSMKIIGLREVDFELTNKVADKKQAERYEKGIFDFQGATLMIVPLITLAILNMACFVGGLWKVIVRGSLNEMFAQIFLTFFIVINSYPLYEGIIVRKDSGRIPTQVAIVSLICSLLLLSLGSVLLAQ